MSRKDWQRKRVEKRNKILNIYRTKHILNIIFTFINKMNSAEIATKEQFEKYKLKYQNKLNTSNLKSL
jgi:hypothetical protein